VEILCLLSNTILAGISKSAFDASLARSLVAWLKDILANVYHEGVVARRSRNDKNYLSQDAARANAGIGCYL
jgi:hypothetical protein